jgi:hypothetical protein
MRGRAIVALESGWSHQTAQIGKDLGAKRALMELMEGEIHPERPNVGYPLIPAGWQAETQDLGRPPE